jgi:type II secretory pathway pseudopilin PulG
MSFKKIGERGSSFIETAFAVALLGIISAAFLSSLSNSSKSTMIADEISSARIIAESQMEYVKEQDYAFHYDPAVLSESYAGFDVDIDVDNMRNGNIQKVTVTVSRRYKNITSLETYKANR